MTMTFQGLNLKDMPRPASEAEWPFFTSKDNPLGLKFSANAWTTRAPDMAMAPEIREGEYILLDPDIAPRPGDIVALVDEFGGIWLRRFRAGLNGKFTGIPANPDHCEVDSVEHGAKVLAVMAAHFTGRSTERPRWPRW